MIGSRSHDMGCPVRRRRQEGDIGLVTRVVVVLYFLEAGLMLVVVPWTRFWDRNYFVELQPADIIVNVRFLLNNVELAFERARKHSEVAQRDLALMILDQLRIEVLTPEDAPLQQIKAKIEEYRPDGVSVPVHLHRPSDMERFVELEYEKMGLP